MLQTAPRACTVALVATGQPGCTTHAPSSPRNAKRMSYTPHHPDASLGQRANMYLRRAGRCSSNSATHFMHHHYRGIDLATGFRFEQRSLGMQADCCSHERASSLMHQRCWVLRWEFASNCGLRMPFPHAVNGACPCVSNWVCSGRGSAISPVPFSVAGGLQSGHDCGPACCCNIYCPNCRAAACMHTCMHVRRL